MVERSQDPRFAFKSSQPVGAGRKSSRERLDRNFAAQPSVPRPVDLAHPARAERCSNLVGAEPSAECEHDYLLVTCSLNAVTTSTVTAWRVLGGTTT